MTKKVKLAIFDKDLKAREYKQFPLSEDGTKIKVRSGGKRNFNPSINNDSFIEFPYRSLLTPWKISWNRVYFAPNGAKKCVDFSTLVVPEPDPALVMQAAESEILTNLGKERIETPFITYILLLLLIGIALKVFGVIV